MKWKASDAYQLEECVEEENILFAQRIFRINEGEGSTLEKSRCPFR